MRDIGDTHVLQRMGLMMAMKLRACEPKNVRDIGDAHGPATHGFNDGHEVASM